MPSKLETQDEIPFIPDPVKAKFWVGIVVTMDLPKKEGYGSIQHGQKGTISKVGGGSRPFQMQGVTRDGVKQECRAAMHHFTLRDDDDSHRLENTLGARPLQVTRPLSQKSFASQAERARRGTE